MEIYNVAPWAAKYPYWVIFKSESDEWHFLTAANSEESAWLACHTENVKVVKVDFSFI